MLLTGRRLFTGLTDGVVEDGALEVVDGRIVAVGPRAEATSQDEMGVAPLE